LNYSKDLVPLVKQARIDVKLMNLTAERVSAVSADAEESVEKEDFKSILFDKDEVSFLWKDDQSGNIFQNFQVYLLLF